MMKFTLPSGRRVEMQSLHILATAYAFRGSASQRENQEQSISGLVRRFYPGDQIPFAIVWPLQESIPPATCIASFVSEPLGPDAGICDSYLVACWFVYHVERSVANIVCEGLSRLDWESNARDVSWW